MNNEELDFTEAEMLRKKAEKQLKENQNKIDTSAMETDVKKLLHELQVHQIELEMQNEELKEAYDTAETALKKYTMLYDFSPMGYFTLDGEGSIIDLNFTGAEMIGNKRFSLLNSNFKLFIAEESLPVFNKFLSKVFTSDTKESCEVLLGSEQNSQCMVYMEGVVIGDDQNCLLSVVDISNFKN
jgi:PAS domain-containing protein